ncbi:MAG: HAD family hydrolase [Candidatus Bathyarchaeia archaeon]|nr:HAD family hydrolase [Candidatus Bathyarchaeota archaeon]
MKNIKGVIFDLDGTLINSSINFIEMRERIINYFRNLKLDFQSSALTISELVEDTINKIKDEDTRERIHEEINKLMNEVELRSLTSVSSIKGVKETLKTLRVKGFKIGVLTRSCREYALKSLEKTCLIDFIDYLVARDDLDTPKPNPISVLKLIEKMELTTKEVLMVGDHVSDALCAKKAGVEFIGVLTGSSSEGEFKKIGCKTIKNVNEVFAFILDENT